MSAPEVGDRVRVIAGQWRGWSGRVLGVWTSHLWLRLSDADGRRYFRAVPAHEVEKVPTTPTDGHRGDETGADADVMLDALVRAGVLTVEDAPIYRAAEHHHWQQRWDGEHTHEGRRYVTPWEVAP